MPNKTYDRKREAIWKRLGYAHTTSEGVHVASRSSAGYQRTEPDPRFLTDPASNDGLEIGDLAAEKRKPNKCLGCVAGFTGDRHTMVRDDQGVVTEYPKGDLQIYRPTQESEDPDKDVDGPDLQGKRMMLEPGECNNEEDEEEPHLQIQAGEINPLQIEVIRQLLLVANVGGQVKDVSGGWRITFIDRDSASRAAMLIGQKMGFTPDVRGGLHGSPGQMSDGVEEAWDEDVDEGPLDWAKDKVAGVAHHFKMGAQKAQQGRAVRASQRKQQYATQAHATKTAQKLAAKPASYFAKQAKTAATVVKKTRTPSTPGPKLKGTPNTPKPPGMSIKRKNTLKPRTPGMKRPPMKKSNTLIPRISYAKPKITAQEELANLLNEDSP